MSLITSRAGTESGVWNRRRACAWRRWSLFGLLVMPALLSAGCAVPQPRGAGRLERITEPTTDRSYYLYLPKDYVEASEAERAQRTWPVVVSFHGLIPYDTAHAQALEWEAEADRYGFVVVAPILRAFRLFFSPQRAITEAFSSDEHATLAILEHVFAETHADRAHVLSTSWSSGGYIAHYMLNQHPDVFTCLAVRQSNFSSSVLDPELVRQSLYHPILIVGTENDFAVCKRETREAIGWYEAHGYKNFAWVYMKSLGHQRTPDAAADFFARVSGARANAPPRALTRRQAIDGNATGLALLAGNLSALETAPDEQPQAAAEPADTPVEPIRRGRQPAASEGPAARRGTGRPVAAEDRSRRDRNATPRRRLRRPTDISERRSPIDISVSSAIGFEPLLLVYSAECPSDWHRTAEFHWSLDGRMIGRGINGQKTLVQPGDYTLELRVVTGTGREHRAEREIRVLKQLEARAGRGR